MVRKENKRGYVDTTGREITPFIYDRAEVFSEGLATVGKDEKYGFIDKNRDRGHSSYIRCHRSFFRKLDGGAEGRQVGVY